MYPLPNAVAFGLVIITVFLGVISANLPSWQASGTVAKAATAAEKPETQEAKG